MKRLAARHARHLTSRWPNTSTTHVQPPTLPLAGSLTLIPDWPASRPITLDKSVSLLCRLRLPTKADLSRQRRSVALERKSSHCALDNTRRPMRWPAAPESRCLSNANVRFGALCPLAQGEANNSWSCVKDPTFASRCYVPSSCVYWRSFHLTPLRQTCDPPLALPPVRKRPLLGLLRHTSATSLISSDRYCFPTFDRLVHSVSPFEPFFLPSIHPSSSAACPVSVAALKP